jgi:hypothetical protein
MKPQTPNSKSARGWFADWRLVIGDSMVLGVWNLVLLDDAPANFLN